MWKKSNEDEESDEERTTANENKTKILIEQTIDI